MRGSQRSRPFSKRVPTAAAPSFRAARSRPFPLLPRQCFSAPPPPPPPLPSWLVLNHFVSVYVGGPTPPVSWEEDAEWAVVECASRTAHACGDHGQDVLDGLALHARLVGPRCVTSALHIRASDGAIRAQRAEFAAVLRRFQEEFSTTEQIWPCTPIDRAELSGHGTVVAADDNHFVVIVTFSVRDFDDLAYYVVYDAVARSLSMVPCPSTCMVKPLAVRQHGAEADGGYGLYEWAPSALARPSRAAADDDDDDENHPWVVQGWRVPQALVEETSMPEVMFSFQGKAFFSDLYKGLICCDLPTAAAATDGDAGGPVVDFDFIPLPPGIPPPLRWRVHMLDGPGALDEERTMRCVPGSVTFVCIDHSAAAGAAGQCGGTKVSLWTLDLASKQWRPKGEFRAGELWKLAGFKRAGLPETAPKCPVLLPDGTLCLVLPRLRMRQQDPVEDHICNLDVQKMRLRWAASLDNRCYRAPIVLPWNFFAAVVPPITTVVRRGIFI